MPPRKPVSQPKSVRAHFFALIMTGSIIGTLWLLQDYLSLIALSLIFAIIVHPVYQFIKEKLRLKNGFAPLLTIVISFFLIIMPLVLSINLFIQETGQLIEDGLINTDTVVGVLEENIKDVNVFLASLPLVNIQIDIETFDKIFQDAGTNLGKFVLDKAVKIGSSSVKFVIDFYLFLILTYFMIPALPDMKKYLLKLSPLGDAIDEMYIDRLVALIISMIKSIFIVAFAQGLLGAIFIWIAGVDYILTLTILMIVASIIPVVGTGFITVPVALYLLAQGDISGGVIVLLGQIIFISNIDNILRAELLSKDTSLHPALMLMGIIGGVQVFGALGLLYGPIIIIVLLTTLQIYTEHYRY